MSPRPAATLEAALSWSSCGDDATPDTPSLFLMSRFARGDDLVPTRQCATPLPPASPARTVSRCTSSPASLPFAAAAASPSHINMRWRSPSSDDDQSSANDTRIRCPPPTAGNLAISPAPLLTDDLGSTRQPSRLVLESSSYRLVLESSSSRSGVAPPVSCDTRSSTASSSITSSTKSSTMSSTSVSATSFVSSSTVFVAFLPFPALTSSTTRSSTTRSSTIIEDRLDVPSADAVSISTLAFLPPSGGTTAVVLSAAGLQRFQIRFR
mmetsp:Transcript_20771/g.42212  ORF Transcript_20771/g.42212 Transcript_20771/m.42212 type:complete len:267 (+) Transcript_20771:2736-3536(+)